MSFEAFKIVHLFGVILFLGNIVVTGVWKVLADRTGESRVIAYAQRLVTLTDWIFTAGGVALILAWRWSVTSICAAQRGSSGAKRCLSPLA
jgi:uncharacterized membrane protein